MLAFHDKTIHKQRQLLEACLVGNQRFDVCLKPKKNQETLTAVSVVVWAAYSSIDLFYDLVVVTGIMDSTEFRAIPDQHFSPYIASIFTNIKKYKKNHYMTFDAVINPDQPR